MLYINACFHICYGEKQSMSNNMRSNYFLLFLTVSYSIFQNGLSVLEMKNLPRISSKNVQNCIPFLCISGPVKISSLATWLQLFISLTRQTSRTQNAFHYVIALLKRHFSLPFCQKVFLGCEFAVFACVAQRPRTVSAGQVPWKGKQLTYHIL